MLNSRRDSENFSLGAIGRIRNYSNQIIWFWIKGGNPGNILFCLRTVIVTKYESQPDSTHFLQPISPDNYDNLLWLGNSLEVP